jgi:peptidyl-prolyl cis-trans isomerase SurA
MRGLAGLALVSTVLLTGCGSVPELNPGVAVQVGDDTFTTNDVHDTATTYCSAQKPQSGQALANHYINGLTAGAFALRSAADQLMAAHDVTVDESYQQAIDQAEPQLAALTSSERDAVIEVGATSVYVDAAQLAVGRAVLAERGIGAPTDKEASAAGHEALLAWIDDHDVRIDPRFGVTIDEGVTTATDTSVSFAVSKTATSADTDTPDADYAVALPQTQRCG